MSSFFAFSGNLSRCVSHSTTACAEARSFWRVALVLGVLVMCASPAAAQDDKARARGLFGEGVAAFDRADFSQALDFFTQAYRLAPHPVVRVNVANCYERLGRHVEAVFNYERFLEEGGASVAPEQREEVEATIARLRKKFGSVVVEIEPQGATLTVDGEPAARGLDGRLSLSVGAHRLRVTKPGFSAAERTVFVEGDGLQTVRVELLSEETEFLAATPQASEPSEAGSRELSRAEAPAARDGRPLRTTAFVLLGGSALMGVGAVVTGILALKAQSDFDDAVGRSRSPMLQASERADARASGLTASDRAHNTALVTDILTVGAVACASTAFVLWLVDRKHVERERRVALRPEVSPHGVARITLHGAF